MMLVHVKSVQEDVQDAMETYSNALLVMMDIVNSDGIVKAIQFVKNVLEIARNATKMINAQNVMITFT